MVFSRHADFNGCYRTIWDDKSRYLCVSVGNLTPTNDMHTQKKKKKKKIDITKQKSGLFLPMSASVFKPGTGCTWECYSAISNQSGLL